MLFSFVHALFFFTLISVLGIFWGVEYHVWGWPSCLGVFSKGHHEPFFHTVGNFWVFESHMGHIECLGRDVERWFGKESKKKKDWFLKETAPTATHGPAQLALTIRAVAPITSNGGNIFWVLSVAAITFVSTALTHGWSSTRRAMFPTFSYSLLQSCFFGPTPPPSSTSLHLASRKFIFQEIHSRGLSMHWWVRLIGVFLCCGRSHLEET